MSLIKTKEEIEKIEEAGRIVYDTHQLIKQNIKPGVTTIYLDKIAEDFIIKSNATPSFKGYGGFPNTICASVNEVVVHGIPSNYSLKEGDIISIDIGACYEGYHADSAWTYEVGNISEEKRQLMDVTKKSLEEVISNLKEGMYVSDIGKIIEKVIEPYKYGIVKELVGHGVGKELHEEPEIPNYNIGKKGIKLKEGMVIAVEPMINTNTPRVVLLEDQFTIATADRLPSAHFEHTILVLKDGCKVLTKR